ncbi:MAG TPA: phosphoribosylaminoimidazolesuccinocarboxamide synthase [Candidatus Binatia bacterium]|nr:phosphoribosylaminoimidazolesuccinocarboxamide synthase [Candidatus Binatia bacterium]
MTNYLTETETRKLVENYMETEGAISSTQAILDSGAISRLKGYRVRPGKVSDSIFGGTFEHKGVTYENPPLNDRNGNPVRVMVRTERISTHDITRGSIPFKDQILAENHNFMRKLLRGALGTSQYDVPGLPDNAVVIAAEDLKQLGVENVMRAYMAKSTTSTSLYQWYVARGNRGRFAGHFVPEGLFTNGPLPYIMDTPSTKSDKNDETVDPDYLFDSGVCTPQQFRQIRNAGIFAFGQVSQYLAARGIIAVDTKTEHGINRKGEIVSQDEIWTMDSSRFWRASDYDKQLALYRAGKDEDLLKHIKDINPAAKEKDYLEGGRIVITPLSLSKEFARGFSEGDKGYTAEQRVIIGTRYIMGIQELLGKCFAPDMRSRDERVIRGLETVVKELL